MEWKRFTVSQAGLVMLGLEDRYLRARVAQAECLLWRLTGDMDRAAGALESLSQDGPSDSTDRRMHSAIGLTAVQRALNGIQVEDMSTAEKSLVDWTPLGMKASPMEESVLFRKHMILGRILRFGGRFEESRAQLERSLDLSRQLDSLNFDEDLRDLICDLADTLRELGDPVSAERHLRTEIGQRGAKTLLELSLAEALFAQGRSDEAEEVCLDIQSRPRLLKLENCDCVSHRRNYAISPPITMEHFLIGPTQWWQSASFQLRLVVRLGQLSHGHLAGSPSPGPSSRDPTARDSIWVCINLENQLWSLYSLQI